MKKVKKPCPIDAAGIKNIDYKDIALMRQYLTKFNRIIPRYYSGVSLANQKKLAAAIKRARYMALLPYVLEVRVPTGAPLPAVPVSPVVTATPPSAALDESATGV